MANAKKTGGFRFLRWLWIVALIFLTIPFILILLINVEVFGKLPDTTQLENPKTPLATEVFSSDGKVLGRYFNENRSAVNYEDLSPELVNALIATEDARFYSHAGVDIRGLVRVFFKTVLLRQSSSGGGSTISQQLAKNLFPRQDFSSTFKKVIRKMQEWVIATRLERLYTKEEIIAMYLNTVEFSRNNKGIKSASAAFFNKDPDELNAVESAVLIGMLKAPGDYDPVMRPNKSLMRRNTVLYQMVKYNYLDKGEYDKLKKQPTDLKFVAESHNEGSGTYFREYLRLMVKKWADENGYDIYTDGLKIHTTIDSRMQKYAEEATHEHMKELQKQFYAQFRISGTKPWTEVPEIIDLTVKRSERYRALSADGLNEKDVMRSFYRPVKMKVFKYGGNGEKDTIMSPLDSIKYYKYFLQPGFMAMEPGTGAVKVWVGGVDYHFFKYDHVDPKAKRQVGSTFKPFVYTVAIDNGFSPCMKMPNTPVIFPEYDNWQPKNSDGKYGGEQTLRKGLQLSTNCITARVMKEVGVQPVVDLAKKMGITSDIPPVPSLCLGVADISVYEMVAAFNTFNNKGTYIEPTLVTRIEDKNGNVLQNFVPKTVDVLSEKTAYIMTDMMKAVTSGGTGTRLRYRYKLNMPMAGKTGTTQNQSDGWFMGLIPTLTGGVWVGAEDRAVHFTNIGQGQGAAMALPIWAFFLQKIYADKSLNMDETLDWQRPPGELGVIINCSEYDNDQSNPDDGSDLDQQIFGAM